MKNRKLDPKSISRHAMVESDLQAELRPKLVGCAVIHSARRLPKETERRIFRCIKK